MIRLVLFACWLTAVHGGGGPIRSYAYSYATPDGRQSRFEELDRGSLSGGYKYKTPEGAVVAVRYSNDERASGDSYVQHLKGRAYRSFFDKASGVRAHSAPVAYRVLPKQSYAFSYATPDGQSRYESNEEGAVKGGYQWTAPDGTVVRVRYIADENGFRTLDDGPVVTAGRSAAAYSYAYSTGVPVKHHVTVTPKVTVTHAQRYVHQPLTYYYAPAPAAASYSVPHLEKLYKVDDDDDNDDDDHDDGDKGDDKDDKNDHDDHDDDDRKLATYHTQPLSYHQVPLPYYYATPPASYSVQKVGNDDDDDDDQDDGDKLKGDDKDDHDDDDRKLATYHHAPQPSTFPVTYQQPYSHPVTYQHRYSLPVTYQHPVTYQQPYSVPVTYPQPYQFPVTHHQHHYNKARVAQVPLMNFGYVPRH